MIDGGDVDEKIISVVENDPFMANYQSIDDLPNHMIEEMMHFFRVYKQLEGKEKVDIFKLDIELSLLQDEYHKDINLLEENMTFCADIFLGNNKTHTGLRMEDVVRVGIDGAENLTNYPCELFEIDC